MYVEMTSTFQRRSICIFNCYSTLIRRQKCNVETTSIFRRRSDVDYYTSKQRRSLNVDSICVFNYFSTSIRRHALTLFRRRFDVALPAGKKLNDFEKTKQFVPSMHADPGHGESGSSHGQIFSTLEYFALTFLKILD